MQANSKRHSYSSFTWPFESEKNEAEGNKIQNFEYLENEKSFLDKIKTIFHSFWNTFLLVKYKEDSGNTL